MLHIDYKLKIGQDEFNIKVEAETEKEFFEKLAFFTSLPKVGPNGEEDLKLNFREIDNYKFYSIVSEEAQMEFEIGQYKGDKGELFAKAWKPLYKKPGEQGQQAEAPAAGPSRFQKTAAPQAQAAPAQTQAPSRFSKPAAAPRQEAQAEESQEQAPAATQAKTGTVLPKEGARLPTPPAAAPAAPSAPAGGAEKRNSLLAKYGVNKPGTNANVRR